MVLTLDISNEDFDAIVGSADFVDTTLFLNFPSDIKGVYEFELLNSIVNIFDYKEQIANQGHCIEADSLFVFGKMKIRIDRVKGADFKLVEGDFFTGPKQYYTWPYTLEKGNVVCICGGSLSFLTDYYASIYIVTENNPKITLTFDLEDAVPIDITNPSSIEHACSKKVVYEHTGFPGKLFNHDFFREHLRGRRLVIKDENG